MQRYKLYTLLFFCAVSFAFSQEDAKIIFEGNQLYHTGKVPEASARYSKALEANPNNRKANFNLGDALYKNAMAVKKGDLQMPANAKMPADSLANLIFDKAAEQFAVVANSVSDKDTLHRAWHNIGNCYLQKKDYEQAVTAYKKSLKFNPKDEETRYNLAFALKNLPKQKKGGGGGGQQNQPKEQKQDQKEKQQPQPNEMSKEQAEQLLKAMMDAEKKLQDKRKQKQEDPSRRDVEKDW